MSNERPDGFMMIGLHKLASQNGDGLVPELYELLTRNAERQMNQPNVAQFPVWEARMPGEQPALPIAEDAANGGNVIAFPARTGETSAEKKRS